jgi:hypothetical protein
MRFSHAVNKFSAFDRRRRASQHSCSPGTGAERGNPPGLALAACIVRMPKENVMKYATRSPALLLEARLPPAANGGGRSRKWPVLATSLRNALEAWALRSIDHPRRLPYY